MNNIIFVDEVSKLEQNISLFHNSQFLGVDSETLGLNPIHSGLRTVQLADDKNTIVIDALKIGYNATRHYLQPIFEDKDIVKIFHNAKFDLKFFKHHLKCDVERIYDSYLSSVLMEGGIRRERGYHSLAGNVHRFLKFTLDKEEQSSDWSGELTRSKIEYAAHDAEVLLPLRETQIERLKKYGLIRCAKLEFECVLPVVWLELCGFYLDMNQWNANADENDKKSHELAKELVTKVKALVPDLPDNFNINSSQQIMKYFILAGVPMPESTGAKVIQYLAKKYELVELLLEYRTVSKRVSTFGPNWAEYIDDITGRVHAEFLQIGAEDTGRFSCTKPNLQNVPKENEFRSCFKAVEGNTLVSGDYSQIELRILADLARDTAAITQFALGKDFHQATADLINRPRSMAKNCNFAIPYGATEVRVAATGNISYEEAKNLMREYFQAFPNFEKWIKKQKRDVLGRNYARTASGRLMRYTPDMNSRADVSAMQRNATNGPIQGTSADILKRALRFTYDKFKDRQDKVKLVNIVHDEINLESPLSMEEEVKYDLNDCMMRAAQEYVHECPVKVDVKANSFWTKDD